MLTADDVIHLCRLHGQRTAILQVSRQANLAQQLNRIVVGENIQPSDERGAWTCNGCGFRGFWGGGLHCVAGLPDGGGNGL